MANEARVLDIFGTNFLIESNGESVGIGGFAYQIYATTKTPAGGNTIKYQQVLYDSGLSAIDAEGTLEIQTGLKNSGRAVSFLAMAHHGDVALTSEKGWIRLKGKNIVIDATNQLYLQGRKIMIRFVFGLLTVIAGVGAIEGTMPLLTGTLIAITGISIMFWGLIGMNKKGQI